MTPLLIVVGAWLAADLFHFAWIATRQRLWERKVRRDAVGLREGAMPYAVGTGPVAVLWIHGFADTPVSFRRMADRLAADGRHTCHAMRLPGAGETVRQAALVTREDWRAAVRREIAALRRDHARVWLVGHSLGASLALLAALEKDPAVDGIVVLAPLIRVSRRRSPLLPPHVWFRLANAAFLLSRTFESCFAVDAVAVDDHGYAYVRDRFIPFAIYRNLFVVLRELQPRAPELRVPVFAALAEGDRVVDTPAAQRWLDAVTGPKQVRVLTETGHALPLERGWERLTDEIRAFIACHDDPRINKKFSQLDFCVTI